MTGAIPNSNAISIIMPVRNEAASLAKSLRLLQRWRKAGHELIVIDGHSTDSSAAIAESLADKVLRCEPGRSRQMHAGALAARGQILLFLHADTQLPSNALQEIDKQIAQGHHWGWFDVAFDSNAVVFRVIAKAMNRRSRLTKVCTGDQGLFVTQALYSQAKGFPQQPLMEDVEFSKRLRALASPAPISSAVTTAARRWQKQGVVRTVLLMWELRLRYFLGATPESLHKRYYPEIPRPVTAYRYPQARLIAFAKSPVAGQVKTRLIPALGAVGAMELQQAMLRRLAAMLDGSKLCPWHFAVAGDMTPAVFHTQGATPQQQHGKDLGVRMRHAAESSFNAGADSVLLVGGDVPALNAQALAESLEVLQRGSDVVFIPAHDGGYVLLGMRRLIPELFDGPQWGGDEVLAKSLEITEALGLEAVCLEALWDVDVPEDLELLEQLDPPLQWRG